MNDESYKNGKRVAVALACWMLASIGIFSSFMFFIAAMSSLTSIPEDPSMLFPLVIPVTWFSLAAMTRDWIRNTRTHTVWIIIGTATGLPLAILFSSVILLYFTVVGLSFYLIFWHLKRAPKLV